MKYVLIAVVLYIAYSAVQREFYMDALSRPATTSGQLFANPVEKNSATFFQETPEG